MARWLEKSPLRWLVYAVPGAVVSVLLVWLTGVIVKALGLNATRMLGDHGLGDGWGVRAAVFLLAFPLGAEVLGTGATAKQLTRLLLLVAGVAAACAAVGASHAALVDPLVLLLGASAVFATALDGRERYLSALGFGVLIVLAQDADKFSGNLTIKTVGAWLVLAILAYAPAVALATLFASGDVAGLLKKSGKSSR